MSKTAKTEVNLDLTEDKIDVDETIIDEDEPVALDAPENEVDVDEDLDELDQLPKTARRNADGSVTLKLNYPVAITSKKAGKVRVRDFDQLVMHRMTGADFRAVDAVSEEHRTVVALARTTKMNQAIANALYDKMDGSDIANAGRVINNFLASGGKAGRKN